ncbi:hypothetical protein LTR74_017803 [Friedmanniomyces endolithicus]|nr:hypothetical protein LTR74_017803 [Friedmanniomyces endolithicus]
MEVATTTTDEQQKPRLLTIPPEVRQNIYDHTVPASNVILVRAEEIAETSTSPALIRFHPRLPLAYVCHEIHNEYLAYFYKKNTLYFTDNVMRTNVLNAFIARYGEEAGLIKSLKVYTMLELKKSYAGYPGLRETQNFRFKIRFEMSQTAGVVTVRDLKTTEIPLLGGPKEGICCCFLVQLAALGMPSTGGLVGILRSFVRYAEHRDGDHHHKVVKCAACGNNKGLFVRGG